MIDRVVFFSKRDMASGMMLEKAEKILKEFDCASLVENVNDIIELYHVKLYIDNDIFLDHWGEEDIKTIRTTVEGFWSLINQFFSNLSDDNFKTHFTSLEWRYQLAFWELVDKCKVFNRISPEVFNNILNSGCCVSDVLGQSSIVKHYNTTLKDFLLNYNVAAELLLIKYVKKKDSAEKEIHLPSSLSNNDKITILDRYLDWDDANLNYIRLIPVAKKLSEFNIPDKIKLKAKRRDEADTKKLLDQNSMAFGYQIGFSEDQKEPKLCDYKDNTICLSYSASWIKANCHWTRLFKNFQELFEMLDETYNITLVSKSSESSIVDIFGVRTENEYPANTGFNSKNNIAYIQILAYSHFLASHNVILEEVIREVFNDFVAHQKIDNLTLNAFPSNESSLLEKIRFLLPEMESLLKKYSLYVDDGHIDPELLTISSSPCAIQNIKSLNVKKYVYGVPEKIGTLQYYFFSDQSMLYYVKPFEGKYQSLYDLLVNEDITLENLQNYQLPIYQKLIEEGYLLIDDEGYTRIKKNEEVGVLKALYYNDFLSYCHFNTESRDIFDRLHEEGLLEFTDTLLSKQEVSYYNYYLNKSEFTNGEDLRNKYIHGTNPTNENVMRIDYYRLLILFILILFKIMDDILIRNRSVTLI